MSGQGPVEPLVLIPGFMCDGALFAHQIAALSREMPVSVIAPVFGERVEEIASAMLGFLPSRCAVLGYGFGGVVALELLRRAPERLTRIGLMTTTPLACTPQEAGDIETRMIAARTGRLSDAVAEDYPASALAPGAMRGEIRSLMDWMAQGLGKAIYLQQARANLRRKDQQGTLRRVRQPALVMCGAYDSLTPVKRHQFMAEMIPYGQLKIFEDAGHLPPVECPDEVTDTIRAWMRAPLVLR